MKSIALFAASALVFGLLPPAHASMLRHDWLFGPSSWPDVVQKVCCDDYCPKPPPCVPPVASCYQGDDYCPKPLPCVRPVEPSCQRDDYCPKPLPHISCPPAQDLKCPPVKRRPVREPVSGAGY